KHSRDRLTPFEPGSATQQTPGRYGPSPLRFRTTQQGRLPSSPRSESPLVPMTTRALALRLASQIPAGARNSRPVQLLRNGRHAVRDNGPKWTIYHLGGRLGQGVGTRLLDRSRRLEIEHGLPGLHSRETNRSRWGDWDWSEGGERWTRSPEWKQGL